MFYFGGTFLLCSRRRIPRCDLGHVVSLHNLRPSAFPDHLLCALALSWLLSFEGTAVPLITWGRRSGSCLEGEEREKESQRAIYVKFWTRTSLQTYG